MMTATETFSENRVPVSSRSDSFFASSGNDASIVPAGHMYLQNAGVCSITGNMNTNSTNIKNFVLDKSFVILFFFNFGDGILCNSS